MQKQKPKVFNNGLLKIYKYNKETEDYDIFVGSYPVSVNKSSGSEYFQSGASQNDLSLVFSVRYCKTVEQIAFNCQLYRAVWNGKTFNLKDFDNYQFENKIIKLLGVNL